MSKKPEMFTTPITRLEIQWLHRQLVSARMMAEGQIGQFTGPLSEDKTKELTQLKEYKEELSKLENLLHDRLLEGEKDRLAIVKLKGELEEALELNPYATVEIRARLDSLPKEEPYRLTFDRETAKFTLKLIERDLEKYRKHVIPGYEKKSEDDFKDPIQNKTYWINKATKAKNILDGLKSKLEKEL